MKNVYDDKTFFDAYAKMERSRSGLAGAGEWRQFETLFPALDGKAVLDLGCGYGWHCKYAVFRGARSVLGIDASEKMIAAAKEKNADEKIEYRVCGLEEFECKEAAYDCVISNLVLHYIADLDKVYGKVYKALKAGGIFLLNIEHPCFTAGVRENFVYGKDGKPLYWPIDGYFYPGERETDFLGEKVKKQHHTLTQILMGLINAGFSLSAVEEARPNEEMLSMPGMLDEMRRPMMLLIKAAKEAE